MTGASLPGHAVNADQAVNDASLRPVTRLTAYAVLPHDGPTGPGHVLVRSSARSDLAGRWSLPGGGVDHGELPVDAVVREVLEETGLHVRVRGVRDVLTDLLDLPHRGVRVHTVRVVYDTEALKGGLQRESSGSSDDVQVLADADAAALPVMPWVAQVLGLPEPEPLRVTPPAHPAPLSGVGGDASGPLGQGRAVLLSDPAGNDREEHAVIRQRIGVYGVAVRPVRPVRPVGDDDPAAEEVLLTSIAAHAPGAGLWTLPGGGIDHGESVREALVREVHEETGLRVLGSRLLGVDAERFTGRSPAGVLEDLQAVRVVFEVTVAGGNPVVVDVGGSTDLVAWVPRGEVADLPCIGFVADALALLDDVALLDAGEPPTVAP